MRLDSSSQPHKERHILNDVRVFGLLTCNCRTYLRERSLMIRELIKRRTLRELENLVQCTNLKNMSAIALTNTATDKRFLYIYCASDEFIQFNIIFPL